ncbi:hypothetical protein [Shinella sp.]|uniref:hypothetical protein n=1 Tax=Shinella sp. TaxID=1870904 RepID=UPI003D2E124F
MKKYLATAIAMIGLLSPAMAATEDAERPQHDEQACLFCCNNSCNGLVATADPLNEDAKPMEIAGGWWGHQGKIKSR